MNAPLAPSEAQAFARCCLERGVDLGELAEIPDLGLAALLYSWTFWARPSQLAPPDDDWLSWGFLTGRGWGKTRAISEHVNAEAMSGRANRIALIAQNEEKTFEVLVDGQSGLIATSPPWARPEWTGGRLLWPNGAQAFIYTPEVPGAIRGPEHHLAWTSELSVWPAATRDEAWKNLRLGLRLGYGRHVWDSNSKRRHPLLRYLLQRATKNPARHRIVRGHTRENADNLSRDALDELLAELEGTRTGDEELGGTFFDESDGSLWKQEWIERSRRDMPAKLARRVIAVDPAISIRAGTDPTGIVEAGLGFDGQLFVLADLSDHHDWDAWGDLAVDRYVEGRADLVVIERNRGGDACAKNLIRAAKDRGLAVILVGDKHVPRHTPGVIHVREVIGRGSKESRADPVAGRYQRGKVSHVNGAALSDLEDELTTWEPDGRSESPNRLDAVVYAVLELIGELVKSKPGGGGMAGLTVANEKLAGTTRGPGISALLSGVSGKRTI